MNSNEDLQNSWNSRNSQSSQHSPNSWNSQILPFKYRIRHVFKDFRTLLILIDLIRFFTLEDIDQQKKIGQFLLCKNDFATFQSEGNFGISGWPCTNNSICEGRRSSVVEIILFNSLQCHAHFALMMAFSQSASIFYFSLQAVSNGGKSASKRTKNMIVVSKQVCVDKYQFSFSIFTKSVAKFTKTAECIKFTKFKLDFFCTLSTLFENYSKCRIWILAFWHFSPIFVLLKLTCLVTLFDPKLQVFKNSPKWTIFGIFN